jgi:tRNA1(Val) A37 N6-methylase TrmN6
LGNISISSNEKNFDLDILKNNIKKLEEILLKHKIYEKKCFKDWSNDFKVIYNNKDVNIQLYIIFALAYFIGHVFVLKIINNVEKDLFHGEVAKKYFKEIKIKAKKKFNNMNLFEFDYFNPIFNILESDNFNFFYSIISKLSRFFFEQEIRPEYYFDFFMQNIISSIVRHGSGEYYTPPFLIKKMVEESYIFGERVLDPCCGSGNFLIEIIKKILLSNKTGTEKIIAINNIYGYDINPLSIFIAKINFLFLINDLTDKIKLNLFNFDSLFQNSNAPNIKFDLIIGNPPWYTYRDIESNNYQEKIKNLAEQLELKPLPKNILNIEISSLFFYQAKQLYLKNNGKIFFVITKGVITGSHASRFRNFKGFKNIKIWMFSKKIEKIFNVDFICLYAQRSDNNTIEFNYDIPTFHFKLKNGRENLDYFDIVELDLEKIDCLVPYSIEKKGNKIYTKKLVTKDEKQNLLPNLDSYYKKLFHKGADLNPRNLIFVGYKEKGDFLVEINPDKRIFKRAKSPWTKKEFTNETIENKYIFRVIKSTELVKFYVYDSYNVFLPLSKKDLNFNYTELSPNAKKFYDKINNLYMKYKKETTKHNSLMDNLNRWNKLINNRQLSKIKVVYNNSGSILNSAIIQGNFLVTGDLSFYDTDNLKEAYYLIAILNSKLMTKQIQIKKSSRHIFKIPFESPIKKYDFNNKNHQRLAELGRIGKKIAKTSITNLLKSTNKDLSKIRIQGFLNKKLEPIIKQIDEILQAELY